MILDILTNSDNYVSLHKRFEKAFEFLKTQDLKTIEVGKYPIVGTDIHASVSYKDGVQVSDAKFEAHNNYIDIQVCIAGNEKLGWKPRSKSSEPKGEYNVEKDVIFYNDKPDTYFDLKEGQFAIFFPEDVHAPMIGQGPIKKIVIKVKL
ncbi:MAG: YhcH/YjgK/YiaL family protein [Candidatus Dadabacteria bacterium]